MKWAKERFNIEVDGLKTLLARPDLRPATISILKEFGQNLAELMLKQMEGKEIDKVVIGGNMVKAGDLFLPEVKRVLNDNGVNPEIFISKLGEKAAMIGAASLFTENK